MFTSPLRKNTLSNDSGAAAMARAFDAEISTREDGQALFYVVAREGTPDAAVRSVGGGVITRLSNPNEALALAPLASHSSLRTHPDLRLAGPVTVDAERFERFTRLIGTGRPSSSAPKTSTDIDVPSTTT